jgi:hypothetical protein
MWVAVPAALLLAWLVACRLMVRRERAWTPSSVAAAVVDAIEADEAETAERPALLLEDADTGTIAPVTDPALWDPVPVTLPTYVGKATAQRTVRTIDLDSTGVWTSGRSEADSKLARDAEQAQRQAAEERRAGKASGSGDRAVGS